MLAPLLYADSENNADQRYFSGFQVPDAFISFQAGKRKIGVLSDLEIERAKKESQLDSVLSLTEWRKLVTKNLPAGKPAIPYIIRALARHFDIRGFRIAADFPAGLAFQLRDLSVKLEIADGSLFPEREKKSAAELEAIREGNRCSALGFSVVEKILGEAKIRAGRLIYDKRELTSERLKFAIESALLEAGAVSLNTIVACGDQACDPHCRGSGPIRAGELLIVDIFPRVSANGYYGDMTRTYLKGRASDDQRHLVATVHEAQKLALAKLAPGTACSAVHETVQTFFESKGYMTTRDAKGTRGFFHGTGHGLGLDIHEMPRLSTTETKALETGNVVTVEPGLYYPGLGGCRIEDVAHITAKSYELLSKHPYVWEIA